MKSNKESLIILALYLALLAWIILMLTSCSAPKTGCRYVVHKKAYSTF
jgi:hypothetical protein